jgi:hypothetical protein
MRWLGRGHRPGAARTGRAHAAAHAADILEGVGGDPPGADLDEGADDQFQCSTCGRTDLPLAGGWDPPVCLECDAALNFEELEIPLGP